MSLSFQVFMELHGTIRRLTEYWGGGRMAFKCCHQQYGTLHYVTDPLNPSKHDYLNF
jgi:hypothetical protein